jgi:hypothetical protein
MYIGILNTRNGTKSLNCRKKTIGIISLSVAGLDSDDGRHISSCVLPLSLLLDQNTWVISIKVINCSRIKVENFMSNWRTIILPIDFWPMELDL